MADTSTAAAPASPAPAVTPGVAAGGTAAPTVDQKVVAPAEKVLHKLLVDGKEEQVDTEELIRRAQMGSSSDKRFREAKALETQAKQQGAKVTALVQSMIQDPVAFVEQAKELGVDPVKFAEAVLSPYYAQQIQEQEEAADPALKKQRDLERRLKAYENQETEAKRKAEEAEQQKETEAQKAKHEAQVKEIGAQIAAALDVAGLPPTNELAYEMSIVLQAAYENGAPTDPKSLAATLKARKLAEWNAAVKAKGSTEFVDPAIKEMIRKEAVEEFKKTHKTSVKSSKRAAEPEPKLKKTFSQMQREMLQGAK